MFLTACSHPARCCASFPITSFGGHANGPQQTQIGNSGENGNESSNLDPSNLNLAPVCPSGATNVLHTARAIEAIPSNGSVGLKPRARWEWGGLIASIVWVSAAASTLVASCLGPSRTQGNGGNRSC